MDEQGKIIKKYELVREDKIEYNGRTLYRIRALKDFADVKAGDLGGYIQCEENLSQDGDCWVYNDAKAYDFSRIYDNAQVRDYAEVYGFSQVYEFSQVYRFSQVYGKSEIYGDSMVGGYSRILGNTKVADARIGTPDSTIWG